MPRAFYDDTTKQAIMKAAGDAREASKTWNEAHEAAKLAGYQGSQQGIIKLLRATEQRTGKTSRKPGRPAGSKNTSRKSPQEVLGDTNVHSDIASLVNNLVKTRINEALDRAIAILQDARA